MIWFTFLEKCKQTDMKQDLLDFFTKIRSEQNSSQKVSFFMHMSLRDKQSSDALKYFPLYSKRRD